MGFPITRMRRLRQNDSLRAMVRETRLDTADMIAPIFIVPGSGIRKPISSLPGQNHLSADKACEYARELRDLGIKSVLLFGIPESKDAAGSAACKDNGVIQNALRELKKATPELVLITDLCFCEYTSHGHCGIMKGEQLDNDATLEILAQQALSHARAGVDIIAPSGMIDGCIGALRRALDSERFLNLPLMSYAAKFSSSFYGPFREAVDSMPQFGDRKSYQMDAANGDEAIREVALDVEEGADIVMVKPALAFLDIIYRVKEKFSVPVAAYNVSGEYAMVKAAAEKGWIDEQQVMLESLLAIKRAGADLIITYFAEAFARLQIKNH